MAKGGRSLAKLTPEQRAEVARYIVRGYTIAGAREAFYADHDYLDPSERYSYGTFRQWASTAQGREEIEQVRREIQEQAPQGRYVHRGERLEVLVETLGALLGRLRDQTLSNKELIELSGETRQVLREIREEAAPYDSASEATRSPMEQFFKEIRSLTPEMQELLMAPTEGPAS